MINYRTNDRFDDRTRTALDYADAITWDPSRADDELWERLHQHFSVPELVELGYFIAMTLGQQRWIITLGTQHGQGPLGLGRVRADGVQEVVGVGDIHHGHEHA